MSRVSCHKRHANALQAFLATGKPLDESGGAGKAALFYFVWAATSTRHFKPISLGTDASTFDNNSRPVWLNIVQMYFSLVFQPLQPNTLIKYLGVERLRTPNLEVNSALPLYQRFRNYTIRATLTYLASDDTEIVRFAME
ncbi:hypothetical protein QBC36DRAFT_151103, partial [Triangularia setosa]